MSRKRKKLAIWVVIVTAVSAVTVPMAAGAAAIERAHQPAHVSSTTPR